MVIGGVKSKSSFMTIFAFLGTSCCSVGGMFLPPNSLELRGSVEDGAAGAASISMPTEHVDVDVEHVRVNLNLNTGSQDAAGSSSFQIDVSHIQEEAPIDVSKVESTIDETTSSMPTASSQKKERKKLKNQKLTHPTRPNKIDDTASVYNGPIDVIIYPDIVGNYEPLQFTIAGADQLTGRDLFEQVGPLLREIGVIPELANRHGRSKGSSGKAGIKGCSKGDGSDGKGCNGGKGYNSNEPQGPGEGNQPVPGKGILHDRSQNENAAVNRSPLWNPHGSSIESTLFHLLRHDNESSMTLLEPTNKLLSEQYPDLLVANTNVPNQYPNVVVDKLAPNRTERSSTTNSSLTLTESKSLSFTVIIRSFRIPIKAGGIDANWQGPEKLVGELDPEFDRRVIDTGRYPLGLYDEFDYDAFDQDIAFVTDETGGNLNEENGGLRLNEGIGYSIGMKLATIVSSEDQRIPHSVNFKILDLVVKRVKSDNAVGTEGDVMSKKQTLIINDIILERFDSSSLSVKKEIKHNYHGYLTQSGRWKEAREMDETEYDDEEEMYGYEDALYYEEEMYGYEDALYSDDEEEIPSHDSDEEEMPPPTTTASERPPPPTPQLLQMPHYYKNAPEAERRAEYNNRRELQERMWLERLERQRSLFPIICDFGPGETECRVGLRLGGDDGIGNPPNGGQHGARNIMGNAALFPIDIYDDTHYSSEPGWLMNFDAGKITVEGVLVD